MNDVRPFRGLRFRETLVGALGEVVCPPYDVISPEEQRALHDRSPFNVVRLELGLQMPGDDASDNRYTRSALTLNRWLAEGALVEEKDPALYLYEQRFPHEGRTLARWGIFARQRLATWDEGVVLPHEETLAGPKADRLQLMRATRCNLSPLFLLFEDPSGTVRAMMEDSSRRPADATADTGDGQVHRLWVVQGEPQRRLAAALQTPQLFMADGHHRYETALAYRDERRKEPDWTPPPNPLPLGESGGGSPPRRGEGPGMGSGAPYDFAMVLLVDAADPGLVVLPTHRVVRGVDPSLLNRLDEALERVFRVDRLEAGDGHAAATAQMLLRRMQERGLEGPALAIYRKEGGGAAVLSLRELVEGRPDGRPVLDVDVLHDVLLEPMLAVGPEELRAGTHVSYTRDASEAVAAVDRGDAQVALLLNPTRVDQVLATARARGKMPQKSTYFYPKPTTGLVINPLW